MAAVASRRLLTIRFFPSSVHRPSPMFSPARLMTTSADAALLGPRSLRARVPLQSAPGSDLRRIPREHGNIVAARQEPLHERLAEESRASSDNDLHARDSMCETRQKQNRRRPTRPAAILFASGE